MRVVECILIDDCLALKRVGNTAKKKAFRRGQRVRGTVSNIALTPDSQVLALKTNDGYLIPEPFLNIIGEVDGEDSRKKDPYEGAEYAEVIEDEEIDKNPSLSSITDSIKASNIISLNSTRSKRAVNFAFGGAAIGLVYAMMKGQNKILASAVGAIGGGIIGNYVSKKIKENE
jgi:hypothetical protein|tara:strand:- start:17514 stop:18032 length:519 start_codon:yes stop_codon:yes gene_type:complete